MMTSSSPSWLKETDLRYEEIARHHTPLTIYLPTINDNGDKEVLAQEEYDLPAEKKDNGAIDKDYQWQHLAQETGIFHQRGTYPSSLLWRKVQGGTLTIHCVDRIRDPRVSRNAPLTALHFRFPVKIRQNCIGFSDWMSRTILYVLTDDCVLYVIPLSEQVFLGEDSRPEVVLEGALIHRPLFMQARFGQGKVALDPPHFMYPVPNSDKIIFAMQNGSLHRYSPQDFEEIRFTGDATLRKTLKTWIPTWSGHNPSYPAHLVLSSVASTKHSLLFTVSADQRLRIWSLETSHYIREYDLTFSQATSGRLFPNSSTTLVALDDIHDHGEYLFYLVTYNPLEEGQFILWGGEHQHGAFSNLVQLQEPFKPELPPGSLGVWTISDFFLAQVKTVSQSHGAIVQNTYEQTLRLWIAWKSYVSSKILYTDITQQHPPKWITIMHDDFDNPSPSDEIESSVEYWVDRITRPGRFTDAVLFFALNIYQTKMLQPDQRRELSSSSKSLRKDLFSGIIGRKAKLNVNQHSEKLDFEKYRLDLSLEFSQFETTCINLAKAGEEFRRLSFDVVTGDAIIVRADGISTVRNLSGAEILEWGATWSDEQFEEVVKGENIRGSLYGDFKDANARAQVTALARAAFKFRGAIAGGNLGDITAGLMDEVMSDSNFAVEDRLWAFYDKYLSDEIFGHTSLKEEVMATLAHIKELSAVFKVLLDILSTDICQDDTVVPLQPMTAIMGDIVSTGVADTVASRWILLRDFALLSTWLYSTGDYEIDPMSRKSIEGYWSEGLRAFKGISLLRHLASTEVSSSSTRQSLHTVPGSMEVMQSDDTLEVVHLPPRTNALRYLIEETLDSSGVGLNYISFPPPMALSLAVASILTQINFSDSYSSMAIRIVSQLIRLGANVEASRFARYLPNTPVGGYVWGHVLLQKGQSEKASSWFSRVAPILAKSGRAVDFEYAKVILKREQLDGIGKGLLRYYEHVARLFEGKHAQPQTIYYSQKALALAGEESADVKDSLLMLSFNTAIDISAYEDAYMALTQLTNYETQRKALEVLIVTMVEHEHSGRLCSFPFTGLEDLVDEILLQRAEEVVDIRPFPSYHKVLFAWRIRHGDFQGAASVMYQRLQMLRNASIADMDVNLETLEISEAYLAVINSLSCVAERNAWIFVFKTDDIDSPSVKRIKRDDKGMSIDRVYLTLGTRTRIALSLEDVRKEYAVELERQQIILGKVADEFGLDTLDV